MGKRYSVKMLEDHWENYKIRCDSKRKPVYGFSPQNLEFAEGSVPAPVPYDVKGFCGFLGLSEPAFYKSYANDGRYQELIDRIRLECENSKREGFEQGLVPPQLAGLWMSRYEGYGQKVDVTGTVPVVLAGDDQIED